MEITGYRATDISIDSRLDEIHDAIIAADASGEAPMAIINQAGEVIATSHKVEIGDDLYCNDYVYGQFGDSAFLRLIYRATYHKKERWPALVRFDNKDYSVGVFAATFGLLLADIRNALNWEDGRCVDFLTKLAIEDSDTFETFITNFSANMTTANQAYQDLLRISQGL
jgi:hypothetical protein